ncbi:MAG: COX15/CtaA family protein [Pseudomonadota bacterium]
MDETLSMEDRHKPVVIWLLACCGLVFGMVVLGGFTRLTGSGLSMVDWRPITGILPPMSTEQWQVVFEMYRQYPEYMKVNAGMSLEAFKGIFWLEYLHRVLGRLVGIAFFVPFVWFLVKGNIRPKESPKYLLMFLLGGAQGLLGWYMVKSGLVDRPNVSQYRLTAHLSMAFLIYGFMLWVALSLLFPKQGDSRHPWFRRTVALVSLLVVTIFSGGFVAGLKAGKIYNTFPKMGDHWIPPEIGAMQPAWLNVFENAVTAQFDHRVLALTTFALIVLYWFQSRHAGFSRRAQIARNAFLHASILQVALGIAAILLAVPIVIGAAHQAVGLLLLTTGLVLTHGLRDEKVAVAVASDDRQPAVGVGRLSVLD